MKRVKNAIRQAWEWIEHLHTAIWLAGLGGAGMVAAFVGGLQRLRSHLDIVVTCTVFLGSLALFVLGLAFRGRRAEAPDLPTPESRSAHQQLAPSNAETLIAKWHAMVTEVRQVAKQTNRTTVDVMVEHPFYPSLHPYLGEKSRAALSQPRSTDFYSPVFTGGTDTFLESVLDDIGRLAQDWRLDKLPVPDSAQDGHHDDNNKAPLPDSHLKRMAPRLKYEGLRCWGDWAFPADLGVCALQVVAIRNTQASIMNTANNVTASIEYTHDDGIERFVVKTAAWIRLQQQQNSPITGGPRLSRSVSLAGNEAQDLLVTMQNRDGRVFSSLEANDSYHDIAIGHWTITATISSDNADTLVLRGGFTLYSDAHRLVFDHPAFT